MKRTVPSVAAFLLVASIARAEAQGVRLPVETPEPPVDVSMLIVYQTQLPALGEVLSEPLVVTDEELADVGSVPLSVSLGELGL